MTLGGWAAPNPQTPRAAVAFPWDWGAHLVSLSRSEKMTSGYTGHKRPEFSCLAKFPVTWWLSLRDPVGKGMAHSAGKCHQDQLKKGHRALLRKVLAISPDT